MATVPALTDRTEAQRWAEVRDEDALWGDLRPELLAAVKTILEATTEDELTAQVLATHCERTPLRTDRPALPQALPRSSREHKRPGRPGRPARVVDTVLMENANGRAAAALVEGVRGRSTPDVVATRTGACVCRENDSVAGVPGENEPVEPRARPRPGRPAGGTPRPDGAPLGGEGAECRASPRRHGPSRGGGGGARVDLAGPC
jgi:hypothetical protein